VPLAVFRKEDWEDPEFQGMRRQGFHTWDPPVLARSGVDGAFEIGGLGPGQWLVCATPRDRPRADPVGVAFAAGETEDVVVAVPRGGTVTVRFEGGPLPDDVTVRLPKLLPRGTWNSGWDEDVRGALRP